MGSCKHVPMFISTWILNTCLYSWLAPPGKWKRIYKNKYHNGKARKITRSHIHSIDTQKKRRILMVWSIVLAARPVLYPHSYQAKHFISKVESDQGLLNARSVLNYVSYQYLRLEKKVPITTLTFLPGIKPVNALKQYRKCQIRWGKIGEVPFIRPAPHCVILYYNKVNI